MMVPALPRSLTPPLNRTIDHLLNQAFVKHLFELNQDALNLSKFRILDCQVNPIKVSKKGGKSVIEFILRLDHPHNGERAKKSIIGKWRPDRRGEATFDLLQELWQKGFDGDDHLRISEPIAYFPEYNLMLTSRARGVELKRILTTDTPAISPHIRQVARWFVKLHRTRVIGVRRFTIREEERELKTWLSHLGRLVPGYREKLRKLLFRVLEGERSLDPETFTLTHGDLHPKNIFVDGNDLTAIDFEQSRVFDPAKDLGYFIAQAKIHSILREREGRSSTDATALQRCLLGEYARRASPEGLDRVPLYEARSYLQHLHYDYWVLKLKIDPVDFKDWVNRAEECLKTQM